MYPLSWTSRKEGIFLCVIVLSLRKGVWSCTGKVNGLKLRLEQTKKIFNVWYGVGFVWLILMALKY